MNGLLHQTLSVISVSLLLFIFHISSTCCATTFGYTGAQGTFTVPASTTSMKVEVIGARGGNYGYSLGGKGARVLASFPVSSGSMYYFNVGGYNGFNGGGAGKGGHGGMVGGGASDIRTNTSIVSRIIVAGGGGGSMNIDGLNGGAGGFNGEDGGTRADFFPAATGGTQTAGGQAGCGPNNYECAHPGKLGIGGGRTTDSWGAGGGGGYYGGGGSRQAGAGGSSFVASSGYNVSYETGYNSDNGYIVISFGYGVPSSQPTGTPSGQPSSQPSSSPSCQPSMKPSSQPSLQPIATPSAQPSNDPTLKPSMGPTAKPSSWPSAQPTTVPTIRPSSGPSSQPSTQPSRMPTSQPSSQPTAMPSSEPSTTPSAIPSATPSEQPSVLPTGTPSGAPSSQPSIKPSGQPSGPPSSQPNTQPTSRPTNAPSAQPSAHPSTAPSRSPIAQPSRTPTVSPSSQPSNAPSGLPSARPSSQPSSGPSAQPTTVPTIRPSSGPSSQPSTQPSRMPTSQPSSQPTAMPSSEPSTTPSAIPSATPSEQPSVLPTGTPRGAPSSQPSIKPSGQPTALPSVPPSSQPSTQPTSQPSNVPSAQPSGHPSTVPSRHPIAQPSRTPTVSPSSQPSSVPIILPSARPLAPPPATNPATQSSSQPSGQLAESFRVFYPPMTHKMEFQISLPYLLTQHIVSDPMQNLYLSSPVQGTGFVLSRGTTAVEKYSRVSDLVNVGFVLNFDFSGRSVANAGDINGDGYDDLIIGVPYAARVYVLFGTSSGFVNMTEGFTVYGAKSSDLTGWSVSGAGNVNSDTFADILIGAPEVLGAGAVYLLYGSNHSWSDRYYLSDIGTDDVRGIVLRGSSYLDAFGVSISGAGDVNGDGCDDVVVGALRQSAFYCGSVSVVFGTPPQQQTVEEHKNFDMRVYSGPSWSWFGYSLDIAGDVNGDSFDDIIVGSAPKRVVAGAPVSYLLYGNRTLPFDGSILSAASLIITDGGVVVSRVGDVNSNPSGDVLIVSDVDLSTGGGLMLQLSVVNNPPTVDPSIVPSLAPTQLPSRPTVAPTQAPSGPTRTPTMQPTQPTSLPSTMPSAPTLAPTVAPSSDPTTDPSWWPSVIPTAVATQRPSTNRPTPINTTAPLTSATRYPLIRPTLQPTVFNSVDAEYVVRVIQSSGTYHRNISFTQFVINATGSSISIVGTGQHSMFTILPVPRSVLRIEAFNTSSDILDLRAFDCIRNFNELALTDTVADSRRSLRGSHTTDSVNQTAVRIQFPQAQTVELWGVTISELKTTTVIFSSNVCSVIQDKQTHTSVAVIVGLSLVVVFLFYVGCNLCSTYLVGILQKNHTMSSTTVNMERNQNRTFVTYMDLMSSEDDFEIISSSSSDSDSNSSKENDSNNSNSGSASRGISDEIILSSNDSSVDLISLMNLLSGVDTRSSFDESISTTDGPVQEDNNAHSRNNTYNQRSTISVDEDEKSDDVDSCYPLSSMYSEGSEDNHNKRRTSHGHFMVNEPIDNHVGGKVVDKKEAVDSSSINSNNIDSESYLSLGETYYLGEGLTF